MSVETSYREQARAARREARETLLAFREARLKSKKRVSAESSEAAGAEPVAHQNETTISPASFFAIESSAPATEAHVPDDIPSEVRHEPGSGDPVAAPVDMAPDVPEEAESANERPPASETEAAEAEAESDDAPFESAEATPDPEAEAPKTTASPVQETGFEKVDADSDLFELPGAGAGMIWMFHQCGVNSLSDLANEETASLSQRLGVVGHILNVEPWIDFARKRVEAQT
ncbi:hypothetical protein GQ651_08850 [Alphaproteobacteria bacterium GH1-50]|uniref:Uncharacterized protein n=1 Tax=Kangsaoukella pontilimi TaxID=2691042 RepID=A0A7C9MAD5_9RHOB|nr:hypothetical protein [Kangsaoukella pontilimi]MXQ07953.1 hypothetical protein [Kangsaoukella pontilimi]